ncbi:MAG: PASTA domain-containing protein [Bacteroidia bacterium]|nr:PASTA domain-containing protein [Bacteroidia bacterium]
MKSFIGIIKRFPLITSMIAAGVILVVVIWALFGWMNSFTRHDEFVNVPDFVGKKSVSLEDFSGDSIRYTIVDSLWDPNQPKGVVHAQDPAPGTKVKQGRMVYLYTTAVVPPTISMPKLEDLSQRQAQYICEGYGLKAVFKEVDDPHRGAVVEQLYNGKRIEPGTPIEKGQTIVLKVGKGDESTADVSIPNLVGLTFRQARGKLMDMQLEWLVVPDAGIKDTLNAIVYDQNPAPGSGRKIIPGSTIDIRVTMDKAKLSGDSL